MPPLAFGLNTTKKSGPSKPAAPKRKPAFGAFGGNDSDDEDAGANTSGAKVQEIEIGGDLDDFDTFAPPAQDTSQKQTKPKNGVPSEPPKLKPKTGQPNTMFGDLSSSLTSRRAAEEASTLDSSVYEYDSVYDSLKPAKPTAAADKDRRPKYMRGLMEAADVRKRDALIAEEKKIAREREEEGDEYAGKEKFVTEAYRKQQEENKRIEEEERRREEEESKKNAGGGMSGFYKDLLKREGQRHDEVVQAAQETAKEGPKEETEAEVVEDAEESRRVKELQDKGADVAVNEEGQVVDKRQLLKGGLNLGAKPTKTKQQQDSKPSERDRRPLSGQQIGSRQAQRERQSRMMAEQLEASMKRNREEEEAQRQEVERQAKSRKTEGEISSAKERYLARKKAAEDAKQKGDS